MQQLSGLDSVFLELESETTPMHVSGLLLYQGAIDEESEDLVQSVQARLDGILDQFPILRQRISDQPALLDDYPYWIDDESFNLGQHVHSLTLPQPGGWAQLRTLAARLHEEPIHLKFPLWDVYVIDGLTDSDDFLPNSFAILVKVHHAAIDGVSMMKILTALHAPDNKGAIKAQSNWQAKPQPTTMTLLWKSYGHQYERRKILLKTITKLVPLGAKPSSQTKSQSSPQKRAPLTQSFTTRFNAPVSASRAFDSVNFELDKIISCKAKVDGATVNDVVVSIVGGGLRKYLQEVGELTHQSLVTGAPVNSRNEKNDFVSANQIGMIRISLGTNIEDPIERLAAVKQGSKKSKGTSKKMGVKTLSNLAQSLDPFFLKLGVRAATSNILNELINTPVHTIVSNVPSPREQFKLGGATLNRVMALGPLIDQVGLFNAVTCTMNSMSVSFVSTAEMLPEPERYAACLLEAYQELCDA